MAHPKGVLIERLQKLGRAKPDFRTDRSGPDHQPTFSSTVFVDGQELGTGEGENKREAERNAAEVAVRSLGKDSNSNHDKAPSQAPATTVQHDQVEAEPEGPFEGPWPVFETVLATAMQIAERRIADNLRGSEAKVAVRDFSLELYKELLQDLGEVVDADD